MQIDFGNQSLNAIFSTLKNHLHTFDDGDRLTPGTFLYHTSWLRDSAFLSETFHLMGLGEKIIQKIDRWLSLQKRNGVFQSQKGEWDSTGQALWILCRHITYYSKNFHGQIDDKLIQRIKRSGIKALKWIERTCKKTENNLLPSGFSAEHFGPNDQYYWDNFWTLAGLNAFLDFCINFSNEKNLLIRINQIKTLLENSVEKSINSIVLGGDFILPASPNREKDSACIGILVSAAPLELYSYDHPIIVDTSEYLYNQHVYDGLFFHQVFHTGYNIYLTIQLAKIFLRGGDTRWITILEAVIRVSSGTYTWPEAIHPQTLGGCMGDGDHGWATSEILCFLRETLILEEKHTLIIGLGIDYHLTNNKKNDIHAIDAPTLQGMVNATWKLIGETKEIHFSLSIRNSDSSPNPTSFKIKTPDNYKAPKGFKTLDQYIYIKLTSGQKHSVIFFKENKND